LTDTVAQALAAHIPRYIASQVRERDLASLTGTPLRRDGAVLFCDVSGFTPLSEALGRHGKEGTETLTTLLNDYFHILIGVLEDWGGDVVKFGGDAVTVLFEPAPSESLPDAFRRACACSLDIFGTLGGTKAASTPWGDFTLSLKIGASAGSCLAGVLGDPEIRLEHILAGGALDRMAGAEHRAKPGWTVVDAQVSFLGPLGLRLEPLGDGFSRLVGMENLPKKPQILPVDLPDIARLRPFLLPAVWGQVEAGTAALLSEHRRVATVFVAFPGLDYGDDSSLARLDAYFRRVAQLLAGYGGSFNRMDMGDKGSKFLCFFGAPESYENNEERAVAFALALRELEREFPWLGAQRAGISTGTTYCGIMGSAHRQEYTVMGDAVNVAARLMATTGEDRVLATEAIRQATSDKFRWGAFRDLTVKGKAAPLRVSTPVAFQRRKQPRAVQVHIGFVGRGAEMEALHSALRRAQRGAQQHPILISGESGMGKTALIETFLAQAAGRGWTTALGTCPPVAAAPFQPWTQVFGTLLSQGGKGRDAIEGVLLRLLPDQREFLCLAMDFLGYAVPLTPQALSLGPQERQDKVVDLLARTLLALASAKPLALALDDLHAADPGTLRLLAEIPPRVSGGSVLFLGASRPGLQSLARVRYVVLKGIEDDEVEAFSLAFLKAKRLPEQLRKLLCARSSGNPLFLLEILQHVNDAGAITRDREGRIAWEGGRAESLPGSVEGLLLARMDRLPLETRNTLKVASCLGPIFDLGLLHSVFKPPTPEEILRERLGALETLGLRRGEGEHASVYSFSHASLREAAYGSVLLANRRAIHLAAGEAIEARGEGETNPALLAFHFGAAEAWDRAIPFGLAAAKAFRDRYDFATALDQYTKVEAWAEKSGAVLEIQDLLHIADCAVTCSENGRALEILGRVQENTFLGTEDRLETGQLLLRILDATGEYGECLRQARGLQEESKRESRALESLEASRYIISCLFRLGRLQEAEEVLNGALTAAGELPGGDFLGPLKILEAAIRFQRGEFSASIIHYQEALAWAEERGHYPTALQAHLGMANPFREQQRWNESIESAERALSYAKNLGSKMNILGSATILGGGLCFVKRLAEALDLLEESRAYLDEKRYPYAACVYLNQIGVAYYYANDVRRALNFYRKCRSLAKKNRINQWIAHSTYNIADGWNTIGNKTKAMVEYRRAIREFRRIEDVPYFVQASQDLLRILEEEGNADIRRRFLTSLTKMLAEWGKPAFLSRIAV
jgi:class 3 adenylate cyclase/tetratricopeptide (TPR) repeat protein